MLVTHLGQVLPQFTQIVEDLSVDLWVFDCVDVAQDTQHPSPHYRGNICVPSGQRAARHDAAVLAGELTGFYNQSMKGLASVDQIKKYIFESM